MTRPKTLTDEALLEIVRRRFLADGVGASTRAMAADAGISEGVIFQRFGTKEELFFRALALPAPDLASALKRAQRTRTLLGGLTGLSEAGLDYLRSIMPSVLLVLSHPASRKRLRQGTGQAQHLLLQATEIHLPFAEYLDSAEAGEAIDRESLIEILLSILLARALHEQIGLHDPGETKGWLKKTLTALLQGF